MKIQWIIVPILTATLTSCGGNAHKPKAATDELISYAIATDETNPETAPGSEDIKKKKTDDTNTSEEQNSSQDSNQTNTPISNPQSDTSDADTEITRTSADMDKSLNQNVRRALMQEEGLSTNAKNIRVIATDGTVTLRGLVENNQEKNRIEDAVKNVDGVKNVDNQLDVKDIEMGS